MESEQWKEATIAWGVYAGRIKAQLIMKTILSIINLRLLHDQMKTHTKTLATILEREKGRLLD